MNDMFDILSVIAQPDEETLGDFWREQNLVQLPKPPAVDYSCLKQTDALKGKRIGVPKMYIGLKDSNPTAKPVTVNPEVIRVWEKAKADLEALGAEIIYTDFPLVTHYEDDSISGEANNVVGAPSNLNQLERGQLVAKGWDDFLKQNNDTDFPNLSAVNPKMLFPKPKGYLPDKFLELRNWIDYPGLPAVAAKYRDTALIDIPGLKQALSSLEAQRKRDLEDWMDGLKLDCIAFPANGDVGFADLEFNLESTEHSLQNGVKYSNGNRAIRHLGVPTISVPMGIMADRKMPVNLTFAGKAYEDSKLLKYAWAYEDMSRNRTTPSLTPPVEIDVIVGTSEQKSATGNKLKLNVSMEVTLADDSMALRLHGETVGADEANIKVYLDGMLSWTKIGNRRSWQTAINLKRPVPVTLGWDLKPLTLRPVMVVVVAEAESAPTTARILWAPWQTHQNMT